MKTRITSMKNKPPKGVVFAMALIVLMIILYFIFSAIFPDIFQSLNKGEIQPIPNK